MVGHLFRQDVPAQRKLSASPRQVVADGSKAWTEWSSIWTKESRPWTQHEKACHSLHTDATKQLSGIQPFVA
jgi:hypothetical protein